ncbi:uncharacterized protein LOC107037556 [Diachasma alloeum]|uniref:uncharacterized protein LOC107037556 n=1 Tax=Diachasma alloeum TaxID=454923 RepID=UPI0007382A66|nr:uncharacterized protein LOC107037556 [Diachasma alloeum]
MGDDNFSIFIHYLPTLFTSIKTASNLGTSLQNLLAPEALGLELEQNFQHFNVIYTDGRKDPDAGYVGAGCHCPKLGIGSSVLLDTHCSVYSAEYIALNLALDVAKSTRDTTHLILSDSLSAIQSLESIHFHPHINPYILLAKKKYREFLDNNPYNTKIVFRWIPTHRGIQGNEVADNLAKNATECSREQYPVPPTDFKAKFKAEGHASTREAIRAQAEREHKPKGALFFQYYWRKNVHPWYHEAKLPRDLIVWVNRARAGHYHLNESLMKIKVVSTRECGCGAEVQDINHVLWECPEYSGQDRELMIDKLIIGKYPRRYTIAAFLLAKDLVPLKIIHEFVKKCKIKI